jgi:hypothetical protein
MVARNNIIKLSIFDSLIRENDTQRDGGCSRLQSRSNLTNLHVYLVRAVPTVDTTHGFHSDHISKTLSIETIPHRAGFFA